MSRFGIVEKAWRDLSRVTPFACYVVGSVEVAHLVSVDPDGVLWSVAAGTRRDLVHWARVAGLRVWPTLGDLVCDLQAGNVVGLVPGVVDVFSPYRGELG